MKLLNDKKESIIKQEPNAINKPNVLIKIALNNELSARDKKIYNIFIRELLLLNFDQFNGNKINIKLSQLSEYLGVTTKSDLYKSLNKFLDTRIQFNSTIEREKRLCKSNMISGYTMPTEQENNDNSGYITIEFFSFLIKTILKYSSQYAKLDFNDINSLKVSHAITLYENFIRTLGTYTYQKVNYTEKELREMLFLNDKYKDIKSFNNQVIKKSIDEINEKTKIEIRFKRVKDKETKETIYKFEINQGYRFNFNKFKKCVINNYKNRSFRYKNNEYIITKDLDEKNSKYLLVNAKTYKTTPEEKAKEIWQFMYQILNQNPKEFAYKFITYKNLDENFSEENSDDNDISEYLNFLEKYEITI